MTPFGTAAGIGLSALSLFGKKKKKKPKTVSSLDPIQQQLYGEYAQALHGQGPLADIYHFDPEKANQVFDENIARPAYRKYQEDVIPSITGQFRGSNLMNSSYTASALSNAGRDVQEALNAQRASYLYNQENNARSAKQAGVQNLLGQQTFAYQRPEEKRNVIQQILESILPMLT